MFQIREQDETPGGERPRRNTRSNSPGKKFKATVQRNTDPAWGENLGTQNFNKELENTKKRTNQSKRSCGNGNHTAESQLQTS